MSFFDNYNDSTRYENSNEETVFSSVDDMPVSECETNGKSSLAVGETLLGLYRVSSSPYSGGMGSVVRVHHTTWNVDLAMKQPHLRTLNETTKELFIRECEAWINLGLHPNTAICDGA